MSSIDQLVSDLQLDPPPFTPLKRVAPRACPDAPRKRRVTFQEPIETPLVPPPWHLDRHDTSIGGWNAERA